MELEFKENSEPLKETPDIESILESLIFVSKDPMTPEQMADALQASEINVSPAQVREALKGLVSKWGDDNRQMGRGIVLRKAAGGYQFLSEPKNASAVKKVVAQKPVQISKTQIEVLAIIAYRQPITRVDVDEIRGVDSAFPIKKLMQLKLLKILGKSEGLGRPLLYGTTKEFLEFFSLNSLNDLPTLKQYEALSAGEEEEAGVDLANVTLKDLFADVNTSMFSDEVNSMSEDALKSLDNALLRINNLEKNQAEKPIEIKGPVALGE